MVALVPPGIPPFELGIVVEVFGLERPELDVPWWYSVTVCTEHPARRPSSVGGFGFFVEHGLEALADADTIIVPGLARRELAGAGRRGARGADAARGYVSICSGAFLLAAAGLLDGREAATHWRYADRLAARHPRVGSTPTCSTSTTATC